MKTSYRRIELLMLIVLSVIFLVSCSIDASLYRPFDPTDPIEVVVVADYMIIAKISGEFYYENNPMQYLVPIETHLILIDRLNLNTFTTAVDNTTDNFYQISEQIKYLNQMFPIGVYYLIAGVSSDDESNYAHMHLAIRLENFDPLKSLDEQIQSVKDKFMPYYELIT